MVFGQKKDGEDGIDGSEVKATIAISALKSGIRRFYNFKEEEDCEVFTLQKQLRPVNNSSFRLKEVIQTL